MRSLRSAAGVAAAAIIMAVLPWTAKAGVRIDVNLSTQKMTVAVDGNTRHVWSVSSGRSGYTTPNGNYRPYRMHKMWYSRKYDNAPMPHSIFYSGGFAIHATSHVSRLGRPASHGCIRLAPGNARTLFNIVKAKGMAATKIVIHGKSPRSAPVNVAKSTPSRPKTVRTSRYRAPANNGLLSNVFGPPPRARKVYVRPQPSYANRRATRYQYRTTSSSFFGW